MTNYHDMPAWVRVPLPDLATMPHGQLWRTAHALNDSDPTQVRSPRQRRILRHYQFEIDYRAKELINAVRADLAFLPTTPEPPGLTETARAWLDARYLPESSIWER